MANSFVFNPFTGNFDEISTITLAAVGSAPNANAVTLTGQVLNLEPADATHPGVITTGAQTLAGVKTFSSLINANAGIDRSTAGTLSFGTNTATSTTINIGNATATVNIQGTTIIENTTTLAVTNPTIILNHGGGAGSGANSGITIEEASSITGYAESSADRNSWILKAPNTAGIATITPGVAGITLDQSSHNPVTIGTANGLSLATQVLSLALSSTSTTGALSSTDWNTFNNKQPAFGSQSANLFFASPNGAPGVPTFRSIVAADLPLISLTTGVTGILPTANGGTGQNSTATFPTAGTVVAITPSNHGVLVSSATGTASVTSAGTAGQVLTSNGASADPTYQAAAGAFTQSYELINLGLATSVAASALTIALKQADGTTDPSTGTSSVKIGFRSATSANGNYNERSATAAASLVVPSVATLGTANGVQQYLYVYALDNSGTIELAISASVYDEGTIQSTTTISAAALSNSVIYSTTGRSNVPIRLIGRLSVTEATAGTWATAPAEVSLQPFSPDKIVARYAQQTGEAMLTGVALRINYETKISDTHNIGTVGTGTFKLTAPITAYYYVRATCTTVQNNGTGSATLVILKNVGATQIAFSRVFREVATNSNFYLDCSGVYKLTAGDFVYATINQNSGNYNTDTDATGSETTFEMYQVSDF